MMLLIGLTNWLTEYSSNQNTVQRYCASQSTQEARRGLWVYLFTALPIWAFYMFLGTALWVFFETFPDAQASAILNGQARAETLMPHFITGYLPAGVAGLVIAAAWRLPWFSGFQYQFGNNGERGRPLPAAFAPRRRRPPLPESGRTIAVVVTLMIAGALWLSKLTPRPCKTPRPFWSPCSAAGCWGCIFLVSLASAATRRPGAGACTLVFTGWTVLTNKGMLPETPAPL